MSAFISPYEAHHQSAFARLRMAGKAERAANKQPEGHPAREHFQREAGKHREVAALELRLCAEMRAGQ